MFHGHVTVVPIWSFPAVHTNGASYVQFGFCSNTFLRLIFNSKWISWQQSLHSSLLGIVQHVYWKRPTSESTCKMFLIWFISCFFFLILGFTSRSFRLNQKTGSLVMVDNAPQGTYDFKVRVSDGVWPDVVSTIQIHIQELENEAIYNSATVRLSGQFPFQALYLGINIGQMHLKYYWVSELRE